MENFTIIFYLCVCISCFIWQLHGLRVTCWLYSKDLLFLPLGSKNLSWSIKTGLFRHASTVFPYAHLTAGLPRCPTLLRLLLLVFSSWFQVWSDWRFLIIEERIWGIRGDGSHFHTCLEPFLTLLAIIAAIYMDVKVILNCLYWF